MTQGLFIVDLISLNLSQESCLVIEEAIQKAVVAELALIDHHAEIPLGGKARGFGPITGFAPTT
jgi:hypothetical protein